MGRSRRTVPDRLRSALRAALLTLCVVSLVSGLARQGAVYFFCSAMQETRSEPCCQRSAPPEPQIDAVPCRCCEAHCVAPLPYGTRERPSERLSASPVVALAPTPIATARVAAASPLRWLAQPRAGPPRPTDLTRLMVFRT